MQIGGDTETTRKCHGDSGGPTYLEVDTPHDEASRVIGVTSHTYDAEDCNKGGVDTRVDAYLDWIDDELRAACEDGTRSWCDEPGILPPDWYDPPTGDDDDDDDDPGGAACQSNCSAAEPEPAGWAVLALVVLASTRRRGVRGQSPARRLG